MLLQTLRVPATQIKLVNNSKIAVLFRIVFVSRTTAAANPGNLAFQMSRSVLGCIADAVDFPAKNILV